MQTSLASSLTRFRRLLPFVRPFVRRLLLVFGLSLFGTILGLLWPIFTKILIDDVLLAKNLRLLLILSGVMLVVTVAGYVVGAFNRYYYTQMTARILFSLRQYLFGHLQALSLRFHTQNRVGDLLSRLNTDIAEVTVDTQAEPGRRDIAILGVSNKLSLAVYQTIDYIRLSPEHGFARPGGERAPKIFQQFEVLGYTNGPDGKKGTLDDVPLGRVDAVQWNLAEYVKRVNDDDLKFVGTLDGAGLFTPALDGPNPERHMLEGNVGDVWIEAWYQPEGAKRPMGARAHLLVMPPRFRFPPIE